VGRKRGPRSKTNAEHLKRKGTDAVTKCARDIADPQDALEWRHGAIVECNEMG
jgi:hypothetical protein